jgi:hypothetical protein
MTERLSRSGLPCLTSALFFILSFEYKIQVPERTYTEPQPPIFVTTQWSVVLAAQEKSPNSMAALETLCHAIWYPLGRKPIL